jgi:hypothetical protein
MSLPWPFFMKVPGCLSHSAEDPAPFSSPNNVVPDCQRSLTRWVDSRCVHDHVEA